MATKKKVAKKAIKEVVEVKSLTEVEMLKADLLNKEIRLKELELIVIQHKKKVMDFEFAKELQSKHNEYNVAQNLKSNNLNKLKQKYKISTDQFSFDPITGEFKDE